MKPVDTSHEQTIQIKVNRGTVLSDVIKQFKEKRKIPVSLSRVFIKVVGLMTELLRFHSIDEGDTIRECLFGNVACNSDEILDILSSNGVMQLPSNDNAREIFIKWHIKK